MKFERLVVQKFKVVCDKGCEICLEADSCTPGCWNLILEKNCTITVTEVYDVVKSILDQSDEKTIRRIDAMVFERWTTIDRETTREKFLTSLIGKAQCLSKITEE